MCHVSASLRTPAHTILRTINHVVIHTLSCIFYVPVLQPDTTFKFGDTKVSVDRKMGRHLRTLSRIPGYLAAIISFKTQQIMLGSTWNKMIAVFAIGIPACVVGGLAYSLASGRDILTGFIQAYGALYKIPGRSLCSGHSCSLTASLFIPVCLLYGSVALLVPCWSQVTLKSPSLAFPQ